MLDVKHVSRRFSDDVLALDDVSFHVADNDFVSILGPSGCGKSTLLRIVAGLDKATSGHIEMRGQNVVAPLEDAGMVFQQAALLPWRTALENILFVAQMRGKPSAADRKFARKLMALAGLSGFEGSYPHQLSGGMQQRVAICRALLLKPSLVLMDEPFGALDVMTRERLGYELQSIIKAGKNTVLFVTHGISEALLLSDKIVILSARPGKLKTVINVDLPRPRMADTLNTLRYIALSQQVRQALDGTDHEGSD